MKSTYSYSGQKPVVHYYGTCWNEEYILSHFLSHHRSIFNKIYIFDDKSTDKSLSMLRKEPNVVVQGTGRPESESYIRFNTHIFNNAWKESRGHADWVVVGNLDEFTYRRDLLGYLNACTRANITLVPVLGFEMIAREPIPSGRQLMQSVKNGAPFPDMCRFAIFNPDAIAEINYSDGRHHSDPTGEIVLPENDRTLNLHYKHVGLERTLVRYRTQNERRSQQEKRAGLGFQYGLTWDQYMTRWQTVERNAFNVFDWYKLDKPYPGPIWWRAEEAKRFPERAV